MINNKVEVHTAFPTENKLEEVSLFGDSLHLCYLLCRNFYGMFFLTAVIESGTIHMLVMKQGQILHLLPNPCDFVLDLKGNT